MRVLKWSGITGVLLALGVYSYVTGAKLAEIEVARLRERLTNTTQELTQIRTENTRLAAAEKAAHAREVEWRERHAREVPSGTSKTLFIQLKSQLDKGASPDRLALLIGSAANTTTCEGKPVTKRFLVRTPISVGASDTVTIADNSVIITAEGLSAANAEGKPEAWFDPNQELTIYFTPIGGGRPVKKAGLLPLHHSVVLADVEYRLSLVKGDRRGFLHVTADRCPLGGKVLDAKRRNGGEEKIVPAAAQKTTP